VRATTSAIPAPIVPRPTTPTVRISRAMRSLVLPRRPGSRSLATG
jgi:hypothetical protein